MRVVGVGDAVVSLVAVAQPLEDVDRVRDGRLRHVDRLEPPLERRVLLEVLAVLVARRGADRLELAAREHRLEDRRGVDRALGRAGADERVQLVDEQHDVAAGLDLLQHLLQALLEVTAVAGAGDERAEVERVDLLALERLGDLALDDGLRQALDHGGLADARARRSARGCSWCGATGPASRARSRARARSPGRACPHGRAVCGSGRTGRGPPTRPASPGCRRRPRPARPCRRCSPTGAGSRSGGRG